MAEKRGPWTKFRLGAEETYPGVILDGFMYLVWSDLEGYALCEFGWDERAERFGFFEAGDLVSDPWWSMLVPPPGIYPIKIEHVREVESRKGRLPDDPWWKINEEIYKGLGF